jgi:plasmid stability protein
VGQWAALENSMLLRTQVLRIEATYLRARAVLATALTGDNRDKLSFAETLARKIERENMPWAKPFVAVVRAAVAHQRGQHTEATTLLAAAGDGFERGDMRLYAAASRRRLGELLPDDRGGQLIAEADAWMTVQRIKNPERMARMLVPGF